MSGKIYKRDIADACEEYNKIFGANKNLYRIMCSMQDGLKPVQRRFLYTLYKGKGRTQFIKMAKAASDTTAAYHPHGNVAVEDVGAKMANPTCNNILAVEGQGNFGSYKSDKAGASRYIECRLSKFAWKCFFEDFETCNVDMKMAYTGDDYEPEVLPARYPYALFNPQLSGIGYAFSSNIPPFNPQEVMEATIKLIKNPNEKIYLRPDSPTGADVVDDGQFETICKTGIGTFTLRGSTEVDEINNTITITSIPLQITIDAIIKNIVELREKKVFDEIKDIKDYTKNKTGVKTIIYLDSTANPYKTVEKLYSKNTGLKKTYPVGLKMIDDYKDYDYGVKSFLLAWIDYRRDTVRSSFNTQLVKAMEDQNMNDALLLVSNDANSLRTVKLSRNSEDRDDFANKLIKEYAINSQQAYTIAGMRIYNFNKNAHKEYQAKKIELIERIKKLENILDDDDEIDKVIIEQLKEGIKLFGKPRKSKIVREDEEVEIPDTEHILALSKDGYIKKVPLELRQIGQVGNQNTQYMTIKINNTESILIFDSTGVVSKIPISIIPDMNLKDTGVLLERFFQVKGNIVSVLIEPKKSDLKKKGKDLFVVFLTKQGFVKKTLLSEFSHINGSMVAVKIPTTDELVATEFAFDNTIKDMVIYTNQGNGIRRDINEFSVMKANARGVRQITMNEDECCIGFDKIDPSKKFIFYITSAGKAKITDVKYFPTMKRKDEVISLINLDKNESLVGIHSVSENDKVVVYKKKSDPEIIDISYMNVSTRVAKAEKMVKTPKGDYVLSYSVITK
jgi:DNA gyrase/topoisomerase IV subunit A